MSRYSPYEAAQGPISDEERLRRVLELTQQSREIPSTPTDPRMAAPPQPDVVPPSQAMVRPDQSYIQQADALTQQAQPPNPYAGMGRGKEFIMRALQGAAGGAIHAQDPGGYTGYLDRQQQVERQREQDLLGRAKELRGEGYTRERDFTQDQQVQQVRELRQQEMQRTQEVQDRPQFKEFGTPGGGISFGQVDARNAQYTQQGEIKPPPPKPGSVNVNQAVDLVLPGKPDSPISGYWDEDARRWRGVDTGNVLEGAVRYQSPAKYPEPIMMVYDRETGQTVPRTRSQLTSKDADNYGSANPSTDAEKRALDAYQRVDQAEGFMKEIEPEITKMSTFDLARLATAPIVAQTDAGKKFWTAVQPWAEAYLRRASGAQVRPDEAITTYKTFFAWPGDTPETLANKAAARETLKEGLKRGAGRAYGEVYGENPNVKPPAAPPAANGGLPKVGDTFQGGKVIKVTPIP